MMNSVLKTPGGKFKTRSIIIDYLYPLDIYVEPFFGAGHVFFGKKPSKVEIINDNDDNIYTFFKVL